MSTLKQSIFWAAFYLTVTLALAQFDYSDSPIIDFAKYFYFVAMIVVPATVFFPSISKVNVIVPMIVWGCLYLVLLQTLDRTSSAPTGSFAIVLLEFILIEVGAWLGYQLAYGISHAESVMDAMALTAFPNRTQYVHDASRQIKIEFTRSRRFHRPLSLLVLQMPTDEIFQIQAVIANIQHDLWNRFSFARMGQIIDEHIRQTDMVFRDRSNRFVILCPETDIENTKILAIRISEAIKQRININIISGAAGFPDDALNFDDLLDVAVSKILHPQHPDVFLSPSENVEVK